MSAAAVAAVSGVGYGVFQSCNRRAVAGMRSVYLGTFMQLAIALGVLVVASTASGDLAVLGSASAAGVLYFLAAGFVHFFCGWTFLNASQKRIGAARTTPLLSTTPVFGAAIAAVTLGQYPDALAGLGVALVVGGALMVSLSGRQRAAPGPRWRSAGFGLGAGLSWAISPVLIRNGLNGLDSPLVGVTIGLALAVAVYAALLPFVRERAGAGDAAGRSAGRGMAIAEGGLRALGSADALAFKLGAGLVVGFATWGRYAALGHASVALVLGVSLVSVPTVLVLSPILMGREVERITPSVVAGAALVVAGAALLAFEG